MNSAKILWRLPSVFLLAGCAALFENPSPFSYPPSRSSGSQSTSATTTSSQLSQYAWEKAMQGMMIGGALAGTYGAGGGLIIGFLTGLFTAESNFAQQTNRIQTEQAKDKALEAQIEQELA